LGKNGNNGKGRKEDCGKVKGWTKLGRAKFFPRAVGSELLEGKGPV